MNPTFEVLLTAGGSVVLAVFFLWLLVTAARQERDGVSSAAPGPQPRPTAAAKPMGKGGYVHG